MYCPKCGKKNLDDVRFCMHCGADLSEYKVEISPKIEVSPKISVSAKAESGMTLKWKHAPIKYAKIEGVGKLPVYEEDTLAKLEDRHFCPLCGNYASLKKLKEIDGVYKVIEKGEEKEVYAIYNLYHCLACDKKLLGCVEEEIVLTEFERNFKFKSEKIPAYKNAIFCKISEEDKVSLSSEASLPNWVVKWLDGTMWYILNFGSYPLVAFCPICKRNWRNIEPVKTCSWWHFQGSEIFDAERYHSNSVKEWVNYSYSHSLYSLWKCGFCGKFLVSHGCKCKEENVSYFAYPMCEFCDNAIGYYACSICGKRICEDCAVKKVVKKRQFFFDKNIKLCPDCAKEG